MYWMSRYVERAENIARFVDVNLNLTLDLGRALKQQWGPLVAVTGDQAEFESRYTSYTRDAVMNFLSLDESYGNSIISCISRARENARTIRENISSAMWEEINRFHLMLLDAARSRRHSEHPHDFYTQVRRQSQLFNGVTDGTLSHGEAWHFANMGRLMERADKTSRILDVRYFLLLPQVEDVGTPVDIVQWSALLRSATALDMYRVRYGRLVPKKVAEFLLLDPDFPRSVRYCVAGAERSLHVITGSPDHTARTSAERRFGRLRAEIEFASVEDIFQRGLHEFIDHLQSRLNEAGDALHESLFNPQTPALEGYQGQG